MTTPNDFNIWAEQYYRDLVNRRGELGSVMAKDQEELIRVASRWINHYKEMYRETEAENVNLRREVYRIQSDANWWRFASWMTLGAFVLLSLAFWI